MSQDTRLPPGGDLDAELTSLLSTMKQDRAPADLEARLLQALAVTSAAGAGAASAKVGIWKKLALSLGVEGLGRSVLLGVFSGLLTCGALTVISAPPAAPPSLTLAPSASGAAPVFQGPSSPDPEPKHAPSEAATARFQASPGAPSRPPSSPAGGSGDTVTAAPPGDLPIEPTASAPPASVQVQAEPPPAPLSPELNDLLKKELLLVRQIAALVESGRCAEARAAIARYKVEHGSGQLAGEVSVLAARCQGR